MTKKNIALTVLFVALVAVWVICFSGWFTKERIDVMLDLHTQRRRAGNNNTPDAPLATFGFNHPYQLVEVKVLSARALLTNAAPLPEWHLVSESNSVPVKMIIYGQWLQGMKPAFANTRPKPLQPGESYHLFIKAVSGEEGDYDFKMPPSK